MPAASRVPACCSMIVFCLATPLLEGAPGIDSSSVLGLLQSWGEVHPRITAALGRVKPSDGRALA